MQLYKIVCCVKLFDLASLFYPQLYSDFAGHGDINISLGWENLQIWKTEDSFFFFYLLLLYIYKKYFLCITYCTQFEANSKVWFSGWIWVNSAHCLPWAIAMLEPILCIAGAWTEPLSEKMMHSAQRRVQIINMFLSKSGLTSKVVCKRHAAASGAYFSCLNSIQRIVGSAWDWDKDPRDAMPRNFNFHWLRLLVGR